MDAGAHRLRRYVVADAYTVTLTALLALTLPPPYAALTLALLALKLLSLTNKSQPALHLPIIALTPHLAMKLVGHPVIAAILAAPTIPPIEEALKKKTKPAWINPGYTPTLKALIATAASLATATLLLQAPSSTITLAALTAYLAYKACRAKGKLLVALKPTPAKIRVLRGETATAKLTISNASDIKVHATIHPAQPWINVKPSQLTLLPYSSQELTLTLKPPLSAPLTLKADALLIDEQGLAAVKQTLTLAHLKVTPRATLARWLAIKILEGRGRGLLAAATAKAGLPPGREEYYGPRPYTAGDRPRDIDWKASLRRRQLIVKDLRGAFLETVIIAGNLDATTPEEADGLLYTLLSEAITTAKEGLPTLLALYNDKETITVKGPEEPLRTLSELLKAIDKASLTPKPPRKLPPQPLLYTSHPAIRQALKLREKAIEHQAKEHPANNTILKAINKQPPPALLTLTTANPDDLEITLPTLNAAKNKGYRVVIRHVAQTR